MPDSAALDDLNLWALFGVTVLLVLVSIEFGYLLGKARHRRRPEEKESPVGTMVGSTLGLLAFMLAFTFGLAFSRYDDRREMVLDEANAIGTAHLRAGFLPTPAKSEARKLLQDYVDLKVEGVDPAKRAQAIARCEEIQTQLWSQLEASVQIAPPNVLVSLYAQSLNEVIDLHSKRILVAMRSRIPTILWAVLYLISILGMAGLGYQAGIAETSRSPAVVVVAVAFSAIMMLIVDLDRPQEGFLRVSQKSMIDLRESLKKGNP